LTLREIVKGNIDAAIAPAYLLGSIEVSEAVLSALAEFSAQIGGGFYWLEGAKG